MLSCDIERLTISRVGLTVLPLGYPGGDGVVQLAPGLLHWDTVVRTVVTRTTAVWSAGGSADPDTAHQRSPLHSLPTPGQKRV